MLNWSRPKTRYFDSLVFDYFIASAVISRHIEIKGTSY